MAHFRLVLTAAAMLLALCAERATALDLNQINGAETERTGLPTLFFPMTRVERIALDEPSGSIPSLSEVFARKVGRPLAEYLAQFA